MSNFPNTRKLRRRGSLWAQGWESSPLWAAPWSVGGCTQSAPTYSLGAPEAPAMSTQKIQKYPGSYRNTCVLQKYTNSRDLSHFHLHSPPNQDCWCKTIGVEMNHLGWEAVWLHPCVAAKSAAPRGMALQGWGSCVSSASPWGDTATLGGSLLLVQVSWVNRIAGLLHIHAPCTCMSCRKNLKFSALNMGWESEFQGPNMIMGMCWVIENWGCAGKQNLSFTLQGFFPLLQRARALHKTMVFRLQHQALHNWWTQE